MLLLSEEIKNIAAPLVMFSDPSILGMFFIGGVILLEKNDNTIESLFVTPLTPSEYILSKAVSLSFISISASVIVAIAAWGINFSPVILIAGIFPTAVLFTLIGIAVASYKETINSYMIEVMPYYVAVFFVPIFEYFDVFSSPLLWIFPTKGSLYLIAGAYKGITPLELILSILTLSFWCVIAYLWAKKNFTKHIIKKTEAKK
jgi:fluoroquinolone transport system permease protein